MKKLLILGAVLAGTAHAQQTYIDPAYGTPMQIQAGQTTVYTDRYGTPIGTAVQQPQPQPAQQPNYSVYVPSQYTPNSAYQERPYDYQRRYGN
jgi:hypothetical protein